MFKKRVLISFSYNFRLKYMYLRKKFGNDWSALHKATDELHKNYVWC